jgi:hypothetical protein
LVVTSINAFKNRLAEWYFASSIKKKKEDGKIHLPIILSKPHNLIIDWYGFII